MKRREGLAIVLTDWARSSRAVSACLQLGGRSRDNARVRSRLVVGDQWSKVRGQHGCGVTNDAGKELLAFSLPSRLLYVIYGSGRRRYIE